MSETIKSERNIVLTASTTTESGRHLAEGAFGLEKTDTALTSTDFGASGTGGSDPSPMLGIRSLTQTPTGAVIIDKSPAYQDGDHLAVINGTPVNSFSGMAKLAKDWKSGDVVELTLERDSETITLPITLGGTSEKPPLEEGIVDVTITKSADNTGLQCAIWSGILGDKG